MLRSLSTYIVPLPKAADASLDAASYWDLRFFGSKTERIPLPPPPALALRSNGYPTLAAADANGSIKSSLSIINSSPGIIDTSYSIIFFLAEILSPIISIDSGDGPIQTKSAFDTDLAKSARSDRNP